VSDRIVVQYAAGETLGRVLEATGDYIKAETLAVSLQPADEPAGSHVAEVKLAGEILRVGLTVAES
jgi:hypothetical protein